MSLRGDERAQAVQVGAVLLFAVLVIFLSTYQAFVVPNQNREVEFDHSQRVQQDMKQLRSAVLSTATGQSQSVTVSLGTRYPPRTVFLNPPPATGRLRTVGSTDTSINVTIDDATASGEVGDFWNGTARTYNTGTMVYDPDYNLYSNAPTIAYENTVLYDDFGEQMLFRSGQTLVDGNRITLVTLNGSYSDSGAGSAAVDFEPVSVQQRTVTVSNATDESLTVSIVSRIGESEWKERLQAQLDENGGRVENVSAEPLSNGQFNRVTVELEPGSYRLRMAKVGVGTGVTDTDATYLTAVSGDGATVQRGGTQRLVVEVRDAYNNPVSGVTVEGGAGTGTLTAVSPTTGSEGRAVFEYDATGVSASSDEVYFSTSYDPAVGGPPSSNGPTNVTMSVSVKQQGEGRNPAYSVSFDTGAMEAYPGLTCSPTGCTYDSSDDSDSTFDLTAVTSPTVSGASVDFALNTTEYGNFTEESDEINSGTADATFDLNATTLGPSEAETITAFVASGSDSDSIPIRLVNTSATSGFQSASATALLPDTGAQNQSFVFTPATEIPAGTRLHIDLDDPQKLSPLQVNYQGGLGATIPLSNSNSNTGSDTAFINITTGASVPAGTPVRVWTNAVRTGDSGRYDVSITREDTDETVSTSFDVDRNTGNAEVANFDATDLQPNTNGQQQTFTFTLTTDVPGGEHINIGLSPAEGSSDVTYQSLTSVNVSTSNTNFNSESGDAWVLLEAPSGGYSAGTSVEVVVTADTDAMTNAPYEIGITRGDAGTTSTTFGTANNPAAIQFNNFQDFTADPQADEFTLDQINVQDADNDDDLDRVEYEVTDSNGNVVASRTDDISGGQYQPTNDGPLSFDPNAGESVEQGEAYTLTATAYDADGNYDSGSLQDTSPAVTISAATHNPNSGNNDRTHTISVTFSGSDADDQFDDYNVTVYDSSNQGYRVGSASNSYGGGEVTVDITDSGQGNGQGDDPYYVVVEVRTNENNPAVARSTAETVVE